MTKYIKDPQAIAALSREEFYVTPKQRHRTPRNRQTVAQQGTGHLCGHRVG